MGGDVCIGRGGEGGDLEGLQVMVVVVRVG